MSEATKALADKINLNYSRKAMPNEYYLPPVTLDELNLICTALRSGDLAQCPENCDCGFSAEVCKTNPCMRKKMATSGLNPEAKYPYCGAGGVAQGVPVAWRAFCAKTGGQMINPPATKDLLIEQANLLYAEHGYVLQPLFHGLAQAAPEPIEWEMGADGWVTLHRSAPPSTSRVTGLVPDPNSASGYKLSSTNQGGGK